ncbi:hypothetical protein [Magnetococcus sp. PR-3]|uniref:hypothetical protein n=1 Tax=Magnetococcus sp. PR-3 TaxID=3120355 RepID=UPI002FCDFCF5
MHTELSPDGRNIIIRIPLHLKRQGGRKKVLPPQGIDSIFAEPHVQDEALLKALGRAHRWLNMLENGKAASIKALAAKEDMDPSYIMRTLRLTLLAPDIVKQILDGRKPENITLERFRKSFPQAWKKQHVYFLISKGNIYL